MGFDDAMGGGLSFWFLSGFRKTATLKLTGFDKLEKRFEISRDNEVYPDPNVPRHGKSLYKPYIVGIYGV